MADGQEELRFTSPAPTEVKVGGARLAVRQRTQCYYDTVQKYTTRHVTGQRTGRAQMGMFFQPFASRYSLHIKHHEEFSQELTDDCGKFEDLPVLSVC